MFPLTSTSTLTSQHKRVILLLTANNNDLCPLIAVCNKCIWVIVFRLCVNFVNLILSCYLINIFMRRQGTAGDMQHRVMSSLTNRIRLWTLHGKYKTVFTALSHERSSLCYEEWIIFKRDKVLKWREYVIGINALTQDRVNTDSSSHQSRQHTLWSGSPRSLITTFPFSLSNTHYLI